MTSYAIRMLRPRGFGRLFHVGGHPLALLLVIVVVVVVVVVVMARRNR